MVIAIMSQESYRQVVGVRLVFEGNAREGFFYGPLKALLKELAPQLLVSEVSRSEKRSDTSTRGNQDGISWEALEKGVQLKDTPYIIKEYRSHPVSREQPILIETLDPSKLNDLKTLLTYYNLNGKYGSHTIRTVTTEYVVG